MLSPVELLDLVTNQTSMFTLDVTVDRFDGGQYVVGDTISIHGTSQRASYLYLFYLDSQGGLSVLFPGPTDANLVPADQRFQIPRSAAGRGFRTANVVGVHRIKAIATSMPLMFSCLSHTSNAGLTDAQTPGSFRLPPSQELMYRDRLRAHLQGKRLPSKSLGRETPADVVGAFAQDEVAFYVGAADTLTSDPGR